MLPLYLKLTYQQEFIPNLIYILYSTKIKAKFNVLRGSK